MTENDGQGESSIAPLFQSGAIIINVVNFQQLTPGVKRTILVIGQHSGFMSQCFVQNTVFPMVESLKVH